MTNDWRKEFDATAADKLREWLPPGSTVYTTLEHVSASGMTRWIIPRAIVDNEPLFLSGYVESVTGLKRTGRYDGIKMEGCGMDMGFALVYDLAYKLYPNGFGCIGDKCPANDHPNGDRDYTPHSDEHPHWHDRAGGYALKHRWM